MDFLKKHLEAHKVKFSMNIQKNGGSEKRKLWNLGSLIVPLNIRRRLLYLCGRLLAKEIIYSGTYISVIYLNYNHFVDKIDGHNAKAAYNDTTVQHTRNTI